MLSLINYVKCYELYKDIALYRNSILFSDPILASVSMFFQLLCFLLFSKEINFFSDSPYFISIIGVFISNWIVDIIMMSWVWQFSLITYGSTR